jgi:hypothetical protein
MTAYTNPDRLPYPDDYSASADSPAAFKALADATQAALGTKAGDASTTTALAGKAAVGHTHTPPQAGVVQGVVTFANVVADGSPTTSDIPKAANQSVFLQVYRSGKMIATLASVQPTSFRIQVFNLGSTPYTDVPVRYLLVDQP